jgi:hypothetical protein
MPGIDNAEDEVVGLGGSHADCGRISMTRFQGEPFILRKRFATTGRPLSLME